MDYRWIVPKLALAMIVLTSCPQSGVHGDQPASPPTKREIKVLGIGNSFTANAFSLLHPMGARSEKRRVILGQAIIGGCSMEKHMRLAKLHEAEPDNSEGKPYALWVTDEQESRTRTRVGLREMLTSDTWDIVTIQQLSAESADVANYRPYAKELYDYIKKHAPQAEVVMHQTWAYRADGDFDRVFPDKPSYGQEDMYRDLNAAYNTIAEELGVRLISVGAAFQLAREIRPFIPDQTTDRETLAPPNLPNDKNSLCVGWSWDNSQPPKLRCDTHHAGIQGKYLAAAVWFEFLTGLNPYAEGIKAGDISDEDAEFLSEIAHKTVAEGTRPTLEPAEKIISDRLLDECLKRGKSYAECGLSARRLLRGWIDDNYDPKTKLIFRKIRGRRLCWDYHNVAADYYSSLVLISNYVAPEYIQPGAKLHETLLSSKKLCTPPNGIPGLYYFDTGKVESEATYLALSEWLRDGLIRIAENLGTDNIWYEETRRLCDAMIRVGKQRGGLYHQCAGSTEALGNMLQSLSRLYVMSGEKRYLEAAEEIGDALLLDPKIDTFRRMVERRDSFRDHGCEMIPGLAELFVVECQLGGERAKSYRDPLMKVLDQILQTSAHPDTGLFCGDLDKDGNTVWLQPPDTWGYVLFSYENFDHATGANRYRKAIEKPIRWLLDNRKNFAQCKEAKLWPHAAHRDTWSDSHESMVILANRLGIFDQQVFDWLDWMTLQSEHRKHLDKQYGPYLNAHDDGSTGRCLCTHMMACSQGVRHEPFQEGLRIGAMPFSDGLALSLESAKPYEGILRFDWPRCVYPTGALDWARLNEMPAWFVVEPERKYIVTLNGSQEKVMLGKELVDGVPIAVEPGVVRTVRVQQVEN